MRPISPHRSAASVDNGAQTELSVVLGTYKRQAFLKLAIASIRRELNRAGIPHEIVVVDGGSTGSTLRWLAKQKDIITIIQHNRGRWKGRELPRRSWGYFMNLGFKAASGKYVCMLSDDCLVVPGAIQNGYRVFEAKLEAGEKLGALAFYWRDWPVEKDYRVGLTLGRKVFVNHGMYLRTALEKVGFIDEDTYSFYHADGDLCLKLWNAGYTCQESGDSYVEHYSHANSAVKVQNLQRQKLDWDSYLTKWKTVFGTDYTGGWLVKEHQDAWQTVKDFFFAHARTRITWFVRVVFDFKNYRRRLRKLTEAVRANG